MYEERPAGIPTASTLHRKLGTVCLFIVFACKTAAAVIKPPRGMSTEHRSSVEACETERQQLPAHVATSAVPSAREKGPGPFGTKAAWPRRTPGGHVEGQPVRLPPRGTAP